MSLYKNRLPHRIKCILDFILCRPDYPCNHSDSYEPGLHFLLNNVKHQRHHLHDVCINETNSSSPHVPWGMGELLELHQEKELGGGYLGVR